MKSIYKRLLSLVLVMSMLFGLAITAFADEVKSKPAMRSGDYIVGEIHVDDGKFDILLFAAGEAGKNGWDPSLYYINNTGSTNNRGLYNFSKAWAAGSGGVSAPHFVYDEVSTENPQSTNAREIMDAKWAEVKYYIDVDATTGEKRLAAYSEYELPEPGDVVDPAIIFAMATDAKTIKVIFNTEVTIAAFEVNDVPLDAENVTKDGALYTLTLDTPLVTGKVAITADEFEYEFDYDSSTVGSGGVGADDVTTIPANKFVGATWSIDTDALAATQSGATLKFDANTWEVDYVVGTTTYITVSEDDTLITIGKNAVPFQAAAKLVHSVTGAVEYIGIEVTGATPVTLPQFDTAFYTNSTKLLESYDGFGNYWLVFPYTVGNTAITISECVISDATKALYTFDETTHAGAFPLIKPAGATGSFMVDASDLGLASDETTIPAGTYTATVKYTVGEEETVKSFATDLVVAYPLVSKVNQPIITAGWGRPSWWETFNAQEDVEPFNGDTPFPHGPNGVDGSFLQDDLDLGAGAVQAWFVVDGNGAALDTTKMEVAAGSLGTFEPLADAFAGTTQDQVRYYYDADAENDEYILYGYIAFQVAEKDTGGYWYLNDTWSKNDTRTVKFDLNGKNATDADAVYSVDLKFPGLEAAPVKDAVVTGITGITAKIADGATAASHKITVGGTVNYANNVFPDAIASDFANRLGSDKRPLVTYQNGAYTYLSISNFDVILKQAGIKEGDTYSIVQENPALEIYFGNDDQSIQKVGADAAKYFKTKQYETLTGNVPFNLLLGNSKETVTLKVYNGGCTMGDMTTVTGAPVVTITIDTTFLTVIGATDTPTFGEPFALNSKANANGVTYDGFGNYWLAFPYTVGSSAIKVTEATVTGGAKTYNVKPATAIDKAAGSTGYVLVDASDITNGDDTTPIPAGTYTATLKYTVGTDATVNTITRAFVVTKALAPAVALDEIELVTSLKGAIDLFGAAATTPGHAWDWHGQTITGANWLVGRFDINTDVTVTGYEIKMGDTVIASATGLTLAKTAEGDPLTIGIEPARVAEAAQTAAKATDWRFKEGDYTYSVTFKIGDDSYTIETDAYELENTSTVEDVEITLDGSEALKWYADGEYMYVNGTTITPVQPNPGIVPNPVTNMYSAAATDALDGAAQVFIKVTYDDADNMPTDLPALKVQIGDVLTAAYNTSDEFGRAYINETKGEIYFFIGLSANAENANRLDKGITVTVENKTSNAVKFPKMHTPSNDAEVTSAAYTVTGATTNTITAKTSVIDSDTTVATFLSKLNKKYFDQDWIVTIAADIPVAPAQGATETVAQAFATAKAKAKAADAKLVDGDVLSVLSSDGTAFRSYTITVTDPAEFLNYGNGTGLITFYSATAPTGENTTITINTKDSVETYTLAALIANGTVVAGTPSGSTYSYTIKTTIINDITVAVAGVTVVEKMTLQITHESNDASVATILGKAAPTWSEAAGTKDAPKTATIDVGADDSIGAADIVATDEKATVTFYGTDSNFTNPSAAAVSAVAGKEVKVYFTVEAENEDILYYVVTLRNVAEKATLVTGTYTIGSGSSEIKKNTGTPATYTVQGTEYAAFANANIQAVVDSLKEGDTFTVASSVISAISINSTNNVTLEPIELQRNTTITVAKGATLTLGAITGDSTLTIAGEGNVTTAAIADDLTVTGSANVTLSGAVSGKTTIAAGYKGTFDAQKAGTLATTTGTELVIAGALNAKGAVLLNKANTKFTLTGATLNQAAAPDQCGIAIASNVVTITDADSVTEGLEEKVNATTGTIYYIYTLAAANKAIDTIAIRGSGSTETFVFDSTAYNITTAGTGDHNIKADANVATNGLVVNGVTYDASKIDAKYINLIKQLKNGDSFKLDAQGKIEEITIDASNEIDLGSLNLEGNVTITHGSSETLTIGVVTGAAHTLSIVGDGTGAVNVGDVEGNLTLGGTISGLVTLDKVDGDLDVNTTTASVTLTDTIGGVTTIVTGYAGTLDAKDGPYINTRNGEGLVVGGLLGTNGLIKLHPTNTKFTLTNSTATTQAVGNGVCAIKIVDTIATITEPTASSATLINSELTVGGAANIIRTEVTAGGTDISLIEIRKDSSKLTSWGTNEYTKKANASGADQLEVVDANTIKINGIEYPMPSGDDAHIAQLINALKVEDKFKLDGSKFIDTITIANTVADVNLGNILLKKDVTITQSSEKALTIGAVTKSASETLTVTGDGTGAITIASVAGELEIDGTNAAAGSVTITGNVGTDNEALTVKQDVQRDITLGGTVKKLTIEIGYAGTLNATNATIATTLGSEITVSGALAATGIIKLKPETGRTFTLTGGTSDGAQTGDGKCTIANDNAKITVTAPTVAGTPVTEEVATSSTVYYIRTKSVGTGIESIEIRGASKQFTWADTKYTIVGTGLSDDEQKIEKVDNNTIKINGVTYDMPAGNGTELRDRVAATIKALNVGDDFTIDSSQINAITTAGTSTVTFANGLALGGAVIITHGSSGALTLGNVTGESALTISGDGTGAVTVGTVENNLVITNTGANIGVGAVTGTVNIGGSVSVGTGALTLSTVGSTLDVAGSRDVTLGGAIGGVTTIASGYAGTFDASKGDYVGAGEKFAVADNLNAEGVIKLNVADVTFNLTGETTLAGTSQAKAAGVCGVTMDGATVTVAAADAGANPVWQEIKTSSKTHYIRTLATTAGAVANIEIHGKSIYTDKTVTESSSFVKGTTPVEDHINFTNDGLYIDSKYYAFPTEDKHGLDLSKLTGINAKLTAGDKVTLTTKNITKLVLGGSTAYSLSDQALASPGLEIEYNGSASLTIGAVSESQPLTISGTGNGKVTITSVANNLTITNTLAAVEVTSTIGGNVSISGTSGLVELKSTVTGTLTVGGGRSVTLGGTVGGKTTVNAGYKGVLTAAGYITPSTTAFEILGALGTGGKITFTGGAAATAFTLTGTQAHNEHGNNKDIPAAASKFGVAYAAGTVTLTDANPTMAGGAKTTFEVKDVYGNILVKGRITPSGDAITTISTATIELIAKDGTF